MKIKKWHLFAFIIIFFGISFYIINLKFDKFYRVNGINNDNRVLIERYLTKDEQEYLIDNQINIEYFIKYIDHSDFELENYQYYNLLESTDRYSKKQDIITTGNILATTLSNSFNSKAYTYCETLIEYYLEPAYLYNTNFNFNHLEYYKLIIDLYAVGDYSYVEDTELYLNKLRSLKVENLLDTFKVLCESYNQDSLKELMTKQLTDNQQIVFNPKDLSTIVDQSHYIGLYQPNELILIQDITRVKYSMYLKGEAVNALTNMYNDLNKEVEGFLLRKAYTSYDTLDQNEVGFNEFQLGLSIEVAKLNSSYDSFEETELSSWLESNSYKYGYILRYPKNKASITGYEYNSHIYRYVGVDLATYLYNNQLTLEEYDLIKE